MRHTRRGLFGLLSSAALAPLMIARAPIAIVTKSPLPAASTDAFVTRYTHKVYSLGYAISRETLERGLNV